MIKIKPVVKKKNVDPRKPESRKDMFVTRKVKFRNCYSNIPEAWSQQRKDFLFVHYTFLGDVKRNNESSIQTKTENATRPTSTCHSSQEKLGEHMHYLQKNIEFKTYF